MGVLERIESIIKANLNDLLSKTENPERILEQLVEDIRSELAEARAQVTAAIREEKRLKMLYLENQQLAEKWEKKAVLAIQLSKDELAREAILRKRASLVLARDYKKEWETHKEVVESLKFALTALEEKTQETEKRKRELITKKRQARINRVLGQNLNDKLSVLDKIGNRITASNEEFDAFEEIKNDELKIKQREAELEAELTKIKKALKNDTFDAK